MKTVLFSSTLQMYILKYIKFTVLKSNTPSLALRNSSNICLSENVKRKINFVEQSNTDGIYHRADQ